jgi:hypothetical protein
MPKTHPIIDRYWSLAAALLLPVIEFSCEGIIRLFMDYEVARAMLSVACIALLIHSWFMQRKYAKSKWRLAFFTLLLSLIALGPLWLGLNVIRAYSYPENWKTDVALYENICYLQDIVEQLAKVLGIAVVLWTIVDLVRWLAKRIWAMG